MGFDPTMLADAAKLGAYHVEAGLREFGAWSQKMVEDLGEKIRPQLAAIWEQVKPFELTTFEPDAPMFYSKAAKVIDEKVGGSAPGDSILATLRNAGVKEQEPPKSEAPAQAVKPAFEQPSTASAPQRAGGEDHRLGAGGDAG